MGRRPKGRTDGLAWGEGTIVARGDRFYARWTEPQPDGTTAKRGRTFATRDEAQDHLRKVAREMRDGRYLPSPDLTVRDVVDQWLKRGAARWKPATLAAYRGRAKTHVYPTLGKLKVDGLTTPRVQHWIDAMQQQGLDANTIDSAHRVLSAALREAAQIGIIGRNPAAGVRKPSIRRKPIAVWTDEEVRRVLAAVSDEPMWHAAYRVAIATGVRPGELAVLRWADIDLDRGVVTVRRTMTKDDEGKQVVGTSTKSGRIRTIALAESAVAALKTWRKQQLAIRLKAARWADLDLVWTTEFGKRVTQRHWQDAQARVIASAGVKKITLHGIRHTAATLMLARGVPLKVVSEILGHASIQITADLYMHVDVDMQRSAAAHLDAIMKA